MPQTWFSQRVDVGMTWQGEGRAAAASKDLMLGEHLPPLTLLCKDALGNNVPTSQVPPGLTLALKAAPPRDAVAELAWEASDPDVDVSADLVRLVSLRVMRRTCEQASYTLLRT